MSEEYEEEDGAPEMAQAEDATSEVMVEEHVGLPSKREVTAALADAQEAIEVDDVFGLFSAEEDDEEEVEE